MVHVLLLQLQQGRRKVEEGFQTSPLVSVSQKEASPSSQTRTEAQKVRRSQGPLRPTHRQRQSCRPQQVTARETSLIPHMSIGRDT
mmetsp:Transcript_45432/g.96700  ORF Transcript_45432/g.96700 Transcript_45432/m.96700 type:complete len:86 (+) Transcript_45432:567-824(+)